MAKIFLAFDEKDVTMGTFNQGCKEDFEEYFSEMGSTHDTFFIKSDRMTSLYITNVTDNCEKFIFAAYSHGLDSDLRVESISYISTIENIGSFKKALFYTVSCHTAKELGRRLIDNGCRCYIGYGDVFNFWDGWKEFGVCANYGLLRFIEGHTTHYVYQMMLKNYDEIIDNVVGINTVVAALLSHNKRSLRVMGEDFAIHDMNR